MPRLGWSVDSGQLAIFPFLHGLFDRAAIDAEDFDAGLFEQVIRLGADVSGNDGFDAEPRNVLAGLDTGSLGGVEVLLVIVNFRAAAFEVKHEEASGPTEAWVDVGLGTGALGGNGYF